MSADYPFIALCSSVLNSKASRKKFTDPLKQKELFTKFGLKKTQITALKNMDIDEILEQVRKELVAASRTSTKNSRVAVGW